MVRKEKIIIKEEVFTWKMWPEHQNLVLRIGEWKHLFRLFEMKTIVAQALNYCWLEEGLRILGYLITECRVCLIVEGARDRIEEIMEVFSDQVFLIIREWPHQLEKADPKWSEWEEQVNEDLRHKLFKEYPFHNHYLIKLITGQDIDLPYYSPHVARMKDRIKNYNFCSAIDYSGAKGPVLVKTKTDLDAGFELDIVI